MNNARRVVKVGSLQESLDAGKVKSQDPYAIFVTGYEKTRHICQSMKF
jgi:hypothetical protein